MDMSKIRHFVKVYKITSSTSIRVGNKLKNLFEPLRMRYCTENALDRKPARATLVDKLMPKPP